MTTLLIVMGTRCKCDDDVAGALVDAVKSVRRNTSLRRVIVEVDSRTALGRSCSSQLCAEALRTRAAEVRKSLYNKCLCVHRQTIYSLLFIVVPGGL